MQRRGRGSILNDLITGGRRFKSFPTTNKKVTNGETFLRFSRVIFVTEIDENLLVDVY